MHWFESSSSHISLNEWINHFVLLFQEEMIQFEKDLAEERSIRLAERKAQRKKERREKREKEKEEERQRELDEKIKRGRKKLHNNWDFSYYAIFEI